MNATELKTVLTEHGKWVIDHATGARADLRGAKLREKIRILREALENARQFVLDTYGKDNPNLAKMSLDSLGITTALEATK